jgi:transcriptional regulator GlxA family with amidase domain
MEAGLGQQVSLARFAKWVNLSPWWLCHLFKNETGLSPLQYLKALRMKHAKMLLETTFLSVKQIASEVGVTDQSHFVRDFKATYGLSPAKLRTDLLKIPGNNQQCENKFG